MILKLVVFTLILTSFISTNIHAEESETLNQIIYQFKVDANELKALIVIETKLKQKAQTLQLQITALESAVSQLVKKQDKVEKKLENDPSALDVEFLKLDEEVINTELTNARFELNEYKSDHENVSGELTLLETNVSLLKKHQVDKRKNIKLLITEKNTSFENINRSITYPCNSLELIEQCKTEAKNILLREISEQFAGLELQSITEMDNFLLVKDEVKTESKVIFNSVDIIGQDMIIVSGKNHLKLTLSAELKKELTRQDLTLLHLKIDTAMDHFLQGDDR